LSIKLNISTYTTHSLTVWFWRNKKIIFLWLKVKWDFKDFAHKRPQFMRFNKKASVNVFFAGRAIIWKQNQMLDGENICSFLLPPKFALLNLEHKEVSEWARDFNIVTRLIALGQWFLLDLLCVCVCISTKRKICTRVSKREVNA
jgi:hypothetical protein